MRRFFLSVLLSAGVMLATANAATIAKRRTNQQARIAQGARSGQLTKHETARLERHQAHITRQVHRDRAANGGHLTTGERRQVRHEQNRNSRQIYRAKHNARVR